MLIVSGSLGTVDQERGSIGRLMIVLAEVDGEEEVGYNFQEQERAMRQAAVCVMYRRRATT